MIIILIDVAKREAGPKGGGDKTRWFKRQQVHEYTGVFCFDNIMLTSGQNVIRTHPDETESTRQMGPTTTVVVIS